MPLASVGVSPLSISIGPATASAVNNQLQSRTSLVGQRHTISKRPLLLDVLVDGSLIDLAGDIEGWHIQRDIQRDKVVGLGVG